MLLISLVSLAIASLSAFVCINVQEDVVRAALACVSVLSILLTLFCAPWPLKLTLFTVPLVVERFYRWSSEQSLD